MIKTNTVLILESVLQYFHRFLSTHRRLTVSRSLVFIEIVERLRKDKPYSKHLRSRFYHYYKQFLRQFLCTRWHFFRNTRIGNKAVSLASKQGTLFKLVYPKTGIQITFYFRLCGASQLLYLTVQEGYQQGSSGKVRSKNYSTTKVISLYVVDNYYLP